MRIARHRGPVVTLSLTIAALFFGTGSAYPAPAAVDELVAKYLDAKRQNLTPQRKGGKKKGGGKKQNPTPLEPLLLKIAKSGGAGVAFVSKEYADPNPEVAAACADALLKSGHEKAIPVVLRGYNRGGKWPIHVGQRTIQLQRLWIEQT